MTSTFDIYDDQENKTKCIPGKALTKKQSRPVLGEISQNTQKRQKRIDKRDGYQVYSGAFNLQTTPHINFPSNNWENSLIHPIAETSQEAEESRQSLTSILTADNQADDLNKKIVSVTSDESSVCQDELDDVLDKSSVFQHDSVDKINLPSNDSSVFQDVSVDKISLSSDYSPVFQDETVDHMTRDMFTVPEYSQGIYQFLKDNELRRMPKWNYMERQTDVTFSMRAILVDWIVEVAEEYKLKTETVYLAVSYTDRFLSKMCVVRSKLQLVGTACLFIASKYEEIYPPGVGEFAFITSDSYTKKQVLRMEQLVLKVLEFDVSMPTSHEFVNQNCQMFHMVGKALHLTLYLNELSLLDGRTFLKFPPSMVAASSVVLARHTLGIPSWTDEMAAQVGYTLGDLKECVVGLYEAFKTAETSLQQTVHKKYKQHRFTNVAEVSPVDIM